MKGATLTTATKRAEGTAAAQGESAPASSLVIHRTIRTFFIAVVLERQLARQRRQTAWPDAAAQAAARRCCAAARTQTRSSTQRAGARALWSGGSRADQQGEQQTNKAAGSVAMATTKRGGDEHRPRNKAAGLRTRSRPNRRGTAWPCAPVRTAAQQRRSAAFRQQRRRWESAANRENRSSRLGRTTNNDSNGESNGGRTSTGSGTTRAAALHDTAGRAGSSGNRAHEGRHAHDRHQTGGRYRSSTGRERAGQQPRDTSNDSNIFYRRRARATARTAAAANGLAGRRSTSGSAAVLRGGAHSNTELDAARGGARPLEWGESSRPTRRAADQQGSWLGRDGDDEKRWRRA